MEDTLRVFSDASEDSQYMTFPVTDETTAMDLLSKALSKLDSNSSGHRLFLITVEGRQERMLESFERPFIIYKSSQEAFRFFTKKPERRANFVDENLAVQSVLRGARVIREGPMKKMGKGVFSDRYFLLDEKHLYYAKTAKLVYQVFTLIRLDTASTRSTEEHGRYSFELQTPHRTYILKCNNNEDKQKWLTSIQRQCFILRENQLFDSLAKKITQEERRRAEVELAQLLSCLEFKGLINFRLGRELIYTFLPKSDKISLLYDIEKFKGEKFEEDASERARMIITKLSQSEDFEQKVQPKVERWVACSERGLNVPRNLFDDYFQETLETAAELFEQLVNKSEFWTELKHLLVHKVVNEGLNAH